MKVTVALLVAALCTVKPAHAQVRQPQDTISAGEHAGPLSDVSRPLRDDSIAVHDGAATIGESATDSARSGSIRDGGTRSMLSGSVSDASRGPMSEPRPPITSGAVAEASAGAVKHDIASPLGERISDPLRELGPLQKQMREQRQQAERAALLDASQPALSSTDAGAAAPAAAPAPDEPDLHADAEFVAEPDWLNQEGDLHGEDAPAPVDDEASPSN
jgi:hypothetical protein